VENDSFLSRLSCSQLNRHRIDPIQCLETTCRAIHPLAFYSQSTDLLFSSSWKTDIFRYIQSCSSFSLSLSPHCRQRIRICSWFLMGLPSIFASIGKVPWHVLACERRNEQLLFVGLFRFCSNAIYRWQEKNRKDAHRSLSKIVIELKSRFSNRREDKNEKKRARLLIEQIHWLIKDKRSTTTRQYDEDLLKTIDRLLDTSNNDEQYRWSTCFTLSSFLSSFDFHWKCSEKSIILFPILMDRLIISLDFHLVYQHLIL
jgi:hypothetical protein